MRGKLLRSCSVLSFAALWSVPFSPIRAQEERVLTSSFGQEFNSYRWVWQAFLAQPLGRSCRFSFRQNLSSSLLALGQGGDRWKDDQTLAAELAWPVSGSILLHGGGRALRFWDRQSGLPNDFSRQELFMGTELVRRGVGRARFEAGPAREVRYAREEWGSHWEVVSEVPGFDIGGYAQEGTLTWGGSKVGGRTNQDQHLVYMVGREFLAGSADTIRVGWDRYRHDQYVNAELERERLRGSSLRLENRLQYALPLGAQAILATRYISEAVEVEQLVGGRSARSRARKEGGLANSLFLRRWGGRSKEELELAYQTQEARYLVPQAESHVPFSRSVALVAPDNRWSLLTLASRLALTPSRRDSLTLALRVSKLQYDTPDTNNFDDHDELRVDVNSVWKRRLNPFSILEVRAGAGLYHLVYIFGERSADNQWSRVFRLSPTVELRPSRAVRFRQRFEVMANYVDYDFEEPLQATRSFVFRRFLAEDSLRVDLSASLRLQVALGWQAEENGRLYWQKFEERPLVGRVERRVRIGLRRSFGSRSMLEAGFAYYEREESRFELRGNGYERVPSGRYIARGPILSFQFWGRGATGIRANLHRQRVSSRLSSPYSTNFITLIARWGW
jgi:hypothetical protein